ncbi:hypothetical protein AAL_02146 [Moelleriella libera RCEF 2490]|uniref:ADF-H domain-containing protein n=1 Tax=Moelleriella libera RCEF 2490 TaxID=1081109 RepID=A0A168F7T5_9HYPO|nr:hypothetical protein AAL_02146 [Moelleriella libera RCEF 2490]
MSLNGLEEQLVAEAFEATTTEPGGWLLLRYEGRDEVKVLSRGSGGIVEMRKAIADYEETSPLYGLLKYRRRSVVIKYLPEDCSRIIQARVAVHFNAVCERFSPYDTIFEITTAKDLRDTKLSAACSLHTATGSTSSSTSSLRRRRLMEIAEEEEEEQRAAQRVSTQGVDVTSPESEDRPSTAEQVNLVSDLASSSENSKLSGATTADVPNSAGISERPMSPGSDAGTISSYPHSKPKVKLGPRPSADTNARPQTAGNFRPVSAIPAGFKMFGKGGKKAKGKEGASLASPQEEASEPSLSASLGSDPKDAEERPKTSSGLPVESVTLGVPIQKKPTISPEKARLMKAMKLREKKKMMTMLTSLEAGTEVAEEPARTGEAGAEETRMPDEDIAEPKSEAEKDSQRTSLDEDDSGVVLDSAASIVPADQALDLTSSDSRPASPLVGSSDADHSTKASSISDSTDETIQAQEAPVKSQTPEVVKDDVTTTGESLEATETAASPTKDTAPIAAVEEPSSKPTDTSPAPSPASSDDAKPRATTIAELSTTTCHADEVERGQDDASLGSISPPISKFSAQSLPTTGTGGGTDAGPESHMTTVNTPTSPSKEELPSAKPADEPSAFERRVSAQDLLAATKAASQPTVVSLKTPVEATKQEITSGAATTTETTKYATMPPEIVSPTPRSPTLPIQLAKLDQGKPAEEEGQTPTIGPSASNSVQQTPVSMTFPPSSVHAREGSSSPHSVRTISNPVRGNLISPGDVKQSSARSVSSGAAYLHHITQQQQSGNLAKKTNIGSSISQRIKALEKLSSTTGEAPVPPTRQRPSSTFFDVKRRDPSRSPSVVDRARSLRHSATPSPDLSQEIPSEPAMHNRLERSGSVSSRLSMFEPSTASAVPRNWGVPTAISGRGRPQSVSVMARIIRDPSQSGLVGFEPSKNPSEYSHLDLKQSTLLVDHQGASFPERGRPPPEKRWDRDFIVNDYSRPARGVPTSFSIARGLMKEGRKSVTPELENAPFPSDRRLSFHANATYPPQMSVSSPRTSLSKDAEQIQAQPENLSGEGDGDKKLSRAGRFMRRLSNLSSARSKPNNSSPAPTAAAEEAKEPTQARSTAAGTPTIASQMGDVNVQFPDNLLWKRRNMCLDSQGFLILSALPAQNGRLAQGTKRYHLSEFRMPYIPDVEVQELPNSVVLDFTEGSGIQVACEDRAGQMRVLQILQEAHATGGTAFAL